MKKIIIPAFLVIGLNSASAQICFDSVKKHWVSSYPATVVSADFNGDGKPDLVTASYTASNLSIRIGTGLGTFNAGSGFFTTGAKPRSLASADFNGDGFADLVSANHGTTSLSVLLGTGTGSFMPATHFVVGATPISVVTGDFNGDSKKDIAYANGTTAKIGVLLGTGTGSFGPVTHYPLAGASIPYELITGDFNNDGFEDMATANFNSDNVTVILGTGTGSFGAASAFAVGSQPIALTCNDLDGDGKLDIATANENSDNSSILLGNGLGSFAAAVNYPAGSNPYGIASGDFDNDGKEDLAVSNYVGSATNNVTVLKNAGAAVYTSTSSLSADLFPMAVLTKDLNNDGHRDIIVTGYNDGMNNISNLSIFLNCNTTPITTGIREDLNSLLSVYPNPSAGIFTIHFNEQPNNAIIDVYTVTGTLIYHTVSNGSVLAVDLATQPEGIYFMQIKTENKTLVQKLIRK